MITQSGLGDVAYYSYPTSSFITSFSKPLRDKIFYFGTKTVLVIDIYFYLKTWIFSLKCSTFDRRGYFFLRFLPFDNRLLMLFLRREARREGSRGTEERLLGRNPKSHISYGGHSHTSRPLTNDLIAFMAGSKLTLSVSRYTGSMRLSKPQ